MRCWATSTFWPCLLLGFRSSLLRPGARGPLAGLASAVPMTALLPALGTGPLIPSLVPVIGDVKQGLLGKTPPASLPP